MFSSSVQSIIAFLTVYTLWSVQSTCNCENTMGYWGQMAVVLRKTRNWPYRIKEQAETAFDNEHTPQPVSLNKGSFYNRPV